MGSNVLKTQANVAVCAMQNVHQHTQLSTDNKMVTSAFTYAVTVGVVE
jgi:hypothetical protein